MREGDSLSMITSHPGLTYRHTFYVPYPWQLLSSPCCNRPNIIYNLPRLRPPPQSTSSPCPMNIYFLNFLRSFLLSPSPSLRASLTHDGIVRSSIEYGAYFAPRPLRNAFGRFALGMTSGDPSVPFFPNADSPYVMYSSFHLGV